MNTRGRNKNPNRRGEWQTVQSAMAVEKGKIKEQGRGWASEMRGTGSLRDRNKERISERWIERRKFEQAQGRQSQLLEKVIGEASYWWGKLLGGNCGQGINRALERGWFWKANMPSTCNVDTSLPDSPSGEMLIQQSANNHKSYI